MKRLLLGLFWCLVDGAILALIVGVAIALAQILNRQVETMGL